MRDTGTINCAELSQSHGGLLGTSKSTFVEVRVRCPVSIMMQVTPS